MITIKQYVGVGTVLVEHAAFIHRYHVNFWQHNYHPKQDQYHLSAVHILRLCSIFKGGYTLVMLPRTVTPYRDSVDETCDHIMYQKLVMR
jgi:hypothetical protein